MLSITKWLNLLKCTILLFLGVLALIFIALIFMAIAIGRYMSRHKGEYKTHEDAGAKDAPDPDTAVRLGKTGHGVPKKEEWFIWE